MTKKRRGRGEGSIYQRTDGTWCATVSDGYKANGSRRRKSVYGATKKEVQEKLKNLHIIGIRDTTKLTVGEWLDRWLQVTAKPSIAPSTYERYEGVVRLHLKPFIGHMQLAKVEPVHIEGLYAEQEQKGVSIRNRELGGVILQSALKHAVTMKLIQFSPCPDVPKHRPEKKEMLVWDQEETAAFLKTAEGTRHYAFYTVALSTGMRLGELFALEWRDIDLNGGFLTVQRTLEEIGSNIRVKPPKTAKSRRRIDLPQFAIEALLNHKRAMLAEGFIKSPVFCNTNGDYLRRTSFRRRSFMPLIKKAGVPQIRLHDLRHTAATLLLISGTNPKIVSERLGHATVAITLDTYSHVLPTMQKQAADQLDQLFG